MIHEVYIYSKEKKMIMYDNVREVYENKKI